MSKRKEECRREAGNDTNGRNMNGKKEDMNKRKKECRREAGYDMNGKNMNERKYD